MMSATARAATPIAALLTPTNYHKLPQKEKQNIQHTKYVFLYFIVCGLFESPTSPKLYLLRKFESYGRLFCVCVHAITPSLPYSVSQVLFTTSIWHLLSDFTKSKMCDNSPYDLIPFESDIDEANLIHVCHFGFIDNPSHTIDVSFYKGDNPYVLVTYIYRNHINNEDYAAPQYVYYTLHHPTVPIHLFTIRDIISVMSPNCQILRNGYYGFNHPNINFYEYIDIPICTIPFPTQFILSLT
jgi:hypothetical protein